MRIAFNTGAVGGPLIGAALVALSWQALHAGVVVLFALSFLTALRLPSLPAPAAALGLAEAVERGGAHARFATIFAAALLAMMTYNAFETLMPVSLTTEHGYPAASWGILFVVNPVLVMLFQLRVTRWTSSIPVGRKLALGLALMGCAFLPLVTTAWAPALVLILVVFVAGEMLWAPSADAVAARLAPPEARGAVMGTMGIAMWVGGPWPALGLRVAGRRRRGHVGAHRGAGLAAGAVYWAGVRLLGSERAPAAEVAEAA